MNKRIHFLLCVGLIVFSAPVIGAARSTIECKGFGLSHPDYGQAMFEDHLPSRSVVFFISSAARNNFQNIPSLVDEADSQASESLEKKSFSEAVADYALSNPVITVDLFEKKPDQEELEFIKESIGEFPFSSDMVVEGNPNAALWEGNDIKIYSERNPEKVVLEMSFVKENSYLQVFGNASEVLKKFMSYVPSLVNSLQPFRDAVDDDEASITICSNQEIIGALCQDESTHASLLQAMPLGGSLYLCELAQNDGEQRVPSVENFPFKRSIEEHVAHLRVKKPTPRKPLRSPMDVDGFRRDLSPLSSCPPSTQETSLGLGVVPFTPLEKSDSVAIPSNNSPFSSPKRKGRPVKRNLIDELNA